MNRFLDFDCNPNDLSPLTLAFIGDCVYELFVREKLVCQANRPVNKLNGEKRNWVNASFQAQSVAKIYDELTPQEIDIFRRGRNARTKNTPKNMSVSDYHYATGLEALFGYLYLCGNLDRLRQLFYIITQDGDDCNE
ncbi:MAG: ribonuclease III [Clostridiales bacterium]|nr:ribonuclease III [Clostridiales bacterium]